MSDISILQMQQLIPERNAVVSITPSDAIIVFIANASSN